MSVSFRSVVFLGLLGFVIGFVSPANLLAAKKVTDTTPEPSTVDSTQTFTQETITVNANEPQSATRTAKVTSLVATSEPIIAVVTIFADPTSNGTGSSGTDGSSAFGTHAFITVRNISSANINVGKFSGIAPGKTMSIGTWGNKTEHKGLWYNLESYFVYKNSAYKSRVSISYGVTSQELATLNSFIKANDKWSMVTNCSSFAVKAWNAFADTKHRLNAGTPSTPKKLAEDIKTKYILSYRTGEAVPWNYSVYYAQGTGTPLKSTTFK